MARLIAVVNAGSATLKLAVFEARDDDVLERSSRKYEWGAHEEMPDAVERAFTGIEEEPEVIGHRVVHGGPRYTAPVRIDADVEDALEQLVTLAPLHNGPAVTAIRAARRRFPDTPPVAVFDTAFHARRPPESMHYALPAGWHDRYGFRRYGFHGIAHASLARAYAQAAGHGMDEVNAVTLQLGTGCSACAIRNGRSIETSMGYTPLEGLVMATRSGDIDPAIVLALLRDGLDAGQIDTALNRRSGLLGLAGTGDMRKVLADDARGNKPAHLALRLFIYRVVLTVGAYLTLLEGDGAIVFGGGIGENAPEIRAGVAQGLKAWNVALDPGRNLANRPGSISKDGGRPVYVCETREEPIIAREVLGVAR